MTGSEMTTHVQNPQAHAAKIRELNDAFRTSLRGGIFVATAGVRALGSDATKAILTEIVQFSEFDTCNDPYGENDFGALKHGDAQIFWKLDYYDKDLLCG